MNKKQANSVDSSSFKRPTAPAVYRPQPIPKVLQTKKAAAPPVYRPQPAPKVLQTKSALPHLSPQKPAPVVGAKVGPARTTPVIQRSTNKQNSAPRFSPPIRPAPLRYGSGVIQRVTYKGVLYDPDTVLDQQRFHAEAKADMEREGTWAPGRSESIIEQIGKTTKTVLNVAALGLEEQGYWKDYDRAINADLAILVAIQRDIDTHTALLEGYIPDLKTRDLSVEVSASLGQLTDAFGRIPKKWKIAAVGVAEVERDVNNLLSLEPWGIQTKLDQKQLALTALQEERALKSLPKPTKPEKALEKDITKLKANQVKAAKLERDALASLKRMPLVKSAVEKMIRESAAAQYARGGVAHASVKSSMKRKKLYLGEIATTENIKNSSVSKARGVLWAKPWSPGVNTAFLEGGVGAKAVYKLKTAIPDNLKRMVVEGRHADFKDAVRDQAAKAYHPFWQGIEGRFTIYTDELTYLMQKGYRLHEFRKKDGSTQQIMVHSDNLVEVTAAYDGR
jgi:hypothetical protein